MNEETTITVETWDRPVTEFSTMAVEETDPMLVSQPLDLNELDSTQGLVPFFSPEQLPGLSISDNVAQETEATVAYAIDYTPVIYDVSNAIIGSVLFGAFLIAGLLIAFKIMEVNPHGR